MRSLLKKIFIDFWQRKILSLILAILTWFFVNHSLTITRTINNVPIRVVNLPKDKAIKGMQNDGILQSTISLEVQGNKNLIDLLNKNDLEVIVDLKDIKKEEFATIITKSNIASKNPIINIDRTIKKLKPQELSIHLSKYVIEKIPVLVTPPIGESPKGYEYLDVWPYKLFLTASGPEETIQNLKVKGLKLTFNLNSISQRELDVIDSTKKRGPSDIISYFIPTVWKKINIPEISVSPIMIDDPNSKALRIDFIKKDFIPINFQIPVILFFSNTHSEKLNPSKITIANNEFIKKINGIDMITTPLYAQGVSELFLNSVQDKLFILINIEPKEENDELKWNIQLVLPSEIEKSFIKNSINNYSIENTQEQTLEEYLKVRFRNNMNKFKLWVSPTEKLNLKINIENNKVYIVPVKK